MDHPNRPPEIHDLLDELARHKVRYVITGSVAARLYGVELEPGDLDITPALDQDNLQRLAQLLAEVEATPNSFGRWESQPDGEKKWVEEPATPETLANWQVDPGDPSTFDHLFRTRYGNFDVVPELAGNYEILMQRAVQKEAFGHAVWVAHVDELLSKLTVPRRKKNIPRVNQLRDIQRTQR